jgi:glycosyltransferase involved in cell wall biosynthesis
VDYCSGASIAVSAEAWKQVGGFDSFYAPAYCEDTDLAFTLRRAGYETWLQPNSVVIHYEGRSHGRNIGSGVKARQVENIEKFYQRWRDDLDLHGAFPTPFPHAEANRSRSRRILILDAQTPTPDRDSGSVNTDQLIRLFLEMGWHVAFAPRNHAFAGEYTRALQRLGVEMLLAPHICNIGDIIQNRRDMYDYILGFRYESLADCCDQLRTAYPRARVIFHDVDLHYLRMQRQAHLIDDRALRIRAELVRDAELELFAKADCSVVVTEAEKAIIESQIPVRNIVVYPYTIGVSRSQRPFEDRVDVCFIGGFNHEPNVDAVVYFVGKIWPLVKPRLPPETRFLIVGPDAPESIRKLTAKDVVVMGHVPQLGQLMDDCRLSVAPLRYGSGIKGKLVWSLAYGLPSVATTLAAEGMGLEHEQHVLLADTIESFAQATVRLFQDKALWHRVQGAGYEFAKENYSWKVGLDTCERILDVADETWIARRGATRQNRLAQIFNSSVAPSRLLGRE